jgi:hypothetical protein
MEAGLRVLQGTAAVEAKPKSQSVGVAFAPGCGIHPAFRGVRCKDRNGIPVLRQTGRCVPMERLRLPWRTSLWVPRLFPRIRLMPVLWIVVP